MNPHIDIKPYFSGIEEKIIELIYSAQRRIYIAIAWFTSNSIKEAILKTVNTKFIDLKILVDDNPTNKKYYFGNNEFDRIYIKTKKFNKEFLHHKFILIDEEIVVTGSYNFSKKAKKNLENIVVIKSEELHSNYSRVFQFLYEDNYLDENIELLFKHHTFARNLLSTYYQFSKQELSKYENKIEVGQFYSYFNGYNDQYSYYPGLIFNKSIRLKKINTTNTSHKDFYSIEEGELPIDKRIIKQTIKSNHINNIIDSFRGLEDLYYLINDEINEAEVNIENHFRRKIDYCYPYIKLEELINSNIDIIIEDELWKTNFEPFLNKVIVNDIFDKIEPLKKSFW